MGKIAAMKAEIISRVFMKAPTEMYPFVKQEMQKGYRGAIEIDMEGCKMCGMCARFCPAEAIEMVPVSDKRKAPLFHQDRCIYCAQCVDVCPPKVISMTTNIETASGTRTTMKVDKIKQKTAQVKAEDEAKAKE